MGCFSIYYQSTVKLKTPRAWLALAALRPSFAPFIIRHRCFPCSACICSNFPRSKYPVGINSGRCVLFSVYNAIYFFVAEESGLLTVESSRQRGRRSLDFLSLSLFLFNISRETAWRSFNMLSVEITGIRGNRNCFFDV